MDRFRDDGPFDFVLMNSLLHHLYDAEVALVLERARESLSNDGCVNIVDLVLPPTDGVARRLARWDRGNYARPVTRWLELFAAAFDTVVVEPFAVGLAGTPLWNLLYFKGRRP